MGISDIVGEIGLFMVSRVNLMANQVPPTDGLFGVVSLRHRIPRDDQHQDLISGERPPDGRPSFVSDAHDEKMVDIEAWESCDATLGGAAGGVCIFSGSSVFAAEIFVAISQKGRHEGRAAAPWRRSTTRNIISIHISTKQINSLFFFPGP